jgi:5-methyltetrahydropteroyltriglutamate--homocysteine methyltransferase
MLSPILRVDQVGSLLRPPALRNAVVRNMQGDLADDELGAYQDEAVRQVVAAQEAIGFPILTDGEFRRRNFIDSVATSVAGMERWRAGWAQRFLAEVEQRDRAEFSAPAPQVADAQPATERLRLVRNIPLAEWRRSSSLSSLPLKVTVVAPHRVAMCIDVGASKPIYSDLEDVLADAAAALHGLVVGLRDAGCPYVQLDAPSYTAFLDADRRAALEAQGVDLGAMLEQVIRAENAAVAGIDGLTIGIHICRGNRPGAKWGSGPYDAIAEQLFPTIAHERLLLEYDTERAGGFEPLRFLPKGKIAVLGVVSTKAAEVETVDQVRRRVDEAARFVPLEQLAISPQCGFSSDVAGPPVPVEAQWRKLEVLTEAARLIWET